MMPLFQVNAPETFRLPAWLKVWPPPTTRAEFISNDEAAGPASVSVPPVTDTVLVPPGLVTVRVLADAAVSTVRVLLPARLYAASALALGVPRSQLAAVLQFCARVAV